jgi:hypothetical protein
MMIDRVIDGAIMFVNALFIFTSQAYASQSCPLHCCNPLLAAPCARLAPIAST